VIMNRNVIHGLAKIYPQLYLNPDIETRERYKDVVLKGMEPEETDLSWYLTDPRDKDEYVKTPVGNVRVVSLYVRSDFVYFVRSVMAAKDGPEAEVPESQGASTFQMINWQRIHAHKQQFIAEELAKGNLYPDWKSEWERFSSVKANYIDPLVLLSCGPYSAVNAGQLGLNDEEWLMHSYTIRKYHELTHVICRSLYPDQISPVWDEIAADAVGLFAAFGQYDIDKARLFLGISDDQYTKGRLENYVSDPGAWIPWVNAAIAIVDRVIKEHPSSDVFALIPAIQEKKPEDPQSNEGC